MKQERRVRYMKETVKRIMLAGIFATIGISMVSNSFATKKTITIEKKPKTTTGFTSANKNLTITTNKKGNYTPQTKNIFEAAYKGVLNDLQYFVETQHADPKTANDENWTPLHVASGTGHLDIVKYLVEECHAQITIETIQATRDISIKRYLQSKKQ